LSVTLDRYTRYYVNEDGGGEIGPVYRASFRVQRANGMDPSSGALPICQTPLIFRSKGCRIRGIKTGFNILTDNLNKELEQTVGNIFKTRFSPAKGNIDEKIKK